MPSSMLRSAKVEKPRDADENCVLGLLAAAEAPDAPSAALPPVAKSAVRPSVRGAESSIWNPEALLKRDESGAPAATSRLAFVLAPEGAARPTTGAATPPPTPLAVGAMLGRRVSVCGDATGGGACSDCVGAAKARGTPDPSVGSDADATAAAAAGASATTLLLDAARRWRLAAAELTPRALPGGSRAPSGRPDSCFWMTLAANGDFLSRES